MLPKRNRLKRKKDFEKVFKNGQGFRQRCLFLKIAKNDLKETRFGFVVSSKISKKAVLRNKTKRRLREIVKKKLNEIKKGLDGVLIALPGIEERSFEEIEKMVNKLFKKANILTTNDI